MSQPKQYKFCRSCEQVKHTDEYYRRANGYLSAWCKPCTSEAASRRRSEQRRAEREARRALPPAERKTCTKCNEEKATSEFYGRHAECKQCARQRQAAIYARPEARARKMAKAREYSDRVRAARRVKTLAKYGITPERYDELYAEQAGACAVCGTSGERLGTGGTATRYNVLCVDHAHDSGRVRGLLCPSCNRGLGLLGDDPERLRRAALYIEQGGD